MQIIALRVSEWKKKTESCGREEITISENQ